MSKYHAQPLVLDNIRFASTKEAHRYQELKLLERAGEIEGLELQPRFKLQVPTAGDDETIGEYRADFAYREPRGRGYVVEDVKGMDTPMSKWKRRHVAAQYGVEVVIT